MFERIPAEMQSYNQWVCWRYEERQLGKLTKPPYDARTGLLASVDNPAQWSTFAEACAAAHHFHGIGFMLSIHDPFSGLDLDHSTDPLITARQIELYEKFNSYSELSPSGKGCHIIVKGTIPQGRRRGNIEVYSSGRYLTMTGNVIEPYRPIMERQQMLTDLWQVMGRDKNGDAIVFDEPQTVDDATIINRCCANPSWGIIFGQLLQGQWQEHYGSQSEADFTFIDYVQMYTRNHDQIARIFRASGLGQRPKAQRNDYVNMMVQRSFDRSIPPVDLEQVQRAFARYRNEIVPPNGGEPLAGPFPVVNGETDQPTATRELVQYGTKNVNPYTVPPGLMGEIAQYLYASAPRPVEEIALCGAIGLMAGICGRAFNTPTGAGLNLYTLLIAPSGTGKEQIASGINKLITQVATLNPGDKDKVPAIREFIGPSEIRSDAALLKHLTNQPCFVSVIGEFGLKLQAMCSPHANSHMTGLRAVFLDLYGKSGKGNVLNPTIYSEKEKNTTALASPAFSIVGESTPNSYYANITEDLVAGGLLPRFLVVEYYGDRVRSNENIQTASNQLIANLCGLTVNALSKMRENIVTDVAFEPAAWAERKKYDRYCDDQINRTGRDAIRDLWNRADIKALKLASLVAVGCNWQFPVVTLEHWQWAERIVTSDVLNMVGRFERGETGRDSEENKQAVEIMKVCRDFCLKSWDEVKKYEPGPKKMHDQHVIPYKYIQSRLVATAAFKVDRLGATNAIKRTIGTLLDSGDLTEVSKTQMQQTYGHARRGFILNVGE